MSDKTANVFSYMASLNTNAGATAAAVELLAKVCSSANGATTTLAWASKEDNLIKLRDAIKAAATE